MSEAIILERPNQIRVVQWIAQKHALKLELLGMKHSRGSVYAAIKRQHNLTGSKQKVLEQLTEKIEREHDHWYDALVNGKPEVTLYGRYEDVKVGAEMDLGHPNFTLARRIADDQFAADIVQRQRAKEAVCQ